MAKFFITGGAGFIGSHICEEIFKSFKNSKIIIYDKLTYAGNKKYLKHIIKSNRVKFIHGDILNYKKYAKHPNLHFLLLWTGVRFWSYKGFWKLI